MDLNIGNANKVLKKYLSKTRKEKYRHSKRVAVISAVLAKRWGTSVENAIIASLLHDIGKSVDERKMLNICIKNNIPVYDFESEEALIALHGKISSLIFEREFKGNNPNQMEQISQAISYHVAGGIGMTILDKIIFIADNIDAKPRGPKLIKDILSGRMDNPDKCMKLIIRRKNK